MTMTRNNWRLKTNPGPSLRFSPMAWAKLLFLRDAGPTEVGGFAISDSADLLYVQDVRLVRQGCTAISVVFDDEAVADFFDEQVDAGRSPQQFGRIWIHTHPGNCPRPSWTDELTFEAAFGSAEWAVMCILAQSGATYARLRFSDGPFGQSKLPVRVHFRRPFLGSDHAAWLREYESFVLADAGLRNLQAVRCHLESREDALGVCCSSGNPASPRRFPIWNA